MGPKEGIPQGLKPPASFGEDGRAEARPLQDEASMPSSRRAVYAEFKARRLCKVQGEASLETGMLGSVG